MKGIGLFILSLVLACMLFPIGISYSILRLVLQAFVALIDHIGRYFFMCAYAVDQMANVVMKDLFNDTLITKEGYKFGNPDETLSSAIGKNNLLETFKKMGRYIDRKLNRIDKNHTVKSIEHDEG